MNQLRCAAPAASAAVSCSQMPARSAIPPTSTSAASSATFHAAGLRISHQASTGKAR